MGGALWQRAHRFRIGLRSLAVLLLLTTTGIEASSQAPPRTSPSGEPFTMTVKDQHGSITPGARITVRDGETYAVAGQATTDSAGQAVFYLNPVWWYVVTLFYEDFCSNEMWWYGYILPQDWYPTPGAVFQRREPWLQSVAVPTEPCSIGQPQQLEVVIDHGYPAMNYDLRVRVRMWLDDDGELPYLYEAISDTQVFYEGLSPFHFLYTPTLPGTYLLRFQVDRNWEGNGWLVADDGGWEWHLDVASGTPMATVSPEPTVTSTPVACRITGTVYEDLNRDGARDLPDPPVRGAHVLLCDPLGDVLSQGLTGQDGGYYLEALGGRDYVVKLGPIPRGYGHTDLSYDVSCANGETHDLLDFPLLVWRLRLPLITKA